MTITDTERAEWRRLAEQTPDGPWRTFANPMRDDGLFVGQDRPQQPYLDSRGEPIRDGLGNVRYPAVGIEGWSLGYQLPPEIARLLAAARIAVPALLDALDERDARLAAQAEELALLRRVASQIVYWYDLHQRPADRVRLPAEMDRIEDSVREWHGRYGQALEPQP